MTGQVGPSFGAAAGVRVDGTGDQEQGCIRMQTSSAMPAPE